MLRYNVTLNITNAGSEFEGRVTINETYRHYLIVL